MDVLLVPELPPGVPGNSPRSVEPGGWAVIEQAKGIIMAQHLCTSDEAFDLMRRASQRANVKVRMLAERMVEQISASGGGNESPWRPGSC